MFWLVSRVYFCSLESCRTLRRPSVENALEYFAGVDTHKETHAIVVINKLGEPLESFTIEARPEGYSSAMERTEKYPDLIWGLEGTGSYGRPFANALIRAGRVVYEVPGTITKRHRHRLRGAGKSDPLDAHAIAEAVLRERESLPRHLEADAEEATRRLYERRNRCVSERTVKVNRIRALAVILQLQLPKDLTTKRSLDALAEQLESTQTYGYADFEALDEMRELFADIERLQRRISEVEDRLRPFVERIPELLAIQGCSLISAAGLIGHIGSIENYRSPDAFASHAGVAPVPCSSGKFQSVRVSTGGNRQLNRCLHNIANVQMRTEGHPGKAYYDRKRAEGKTHREALRCLKRKLANVVFRIMRAAEARRQLLERAAAA
jgi:transposase